LFRILLVITHWKLKLNKLQLGLVLIKHDFKPPKQSCCFSDAPLRLCNRFAVGNWRVHANSSNLKIGSVNGETVLIVTIQTPSKLFLRRCYYHEKSHTASIIQYCLRQWLLRRFKHVTKSFISCVVLGKRKLVWCIR